jgi:hypothetical protein
MLLNAGTEDAASPTRSSKSSSKLNAILTKSISMLLHISASLQVNDPSIRRCIGFAKAWGYGGLIMTNAFGLRATSPTVLRAAIDPIGPENDRWLVASSKEAALVVAAWGNHGEFGQRSCAIRALGMPLHHLGLTASGMPKHPLYLKASLKPVRWT